MTKAFPSWQDATEVQWREACRQGIRAVNARIREERRALTSDTHQLSWVDWLQQQDAEARNDAIQKSIEVSLDLLPNSERDRFTQLGKVADAAAVHLRLVEAWDALPKLPDAYAWRWIAYHLVEAGRKEDLRRLLLD